jgi:hypothetical protein
MICLFLTCRCLSGLLPRPALLPAAVVRCGTTARGGWRKLTACQGGPATTACSATPGFSFFRADATGNLGGLTTHLRNSFTSSSSSGRTA